MHQEIIILLQLLLAHVLTDFVLQPTRFIKHKQGLVLRSWFLYVHAFLAGFLSLLFLQDPELWHIAVFIGVTHFFIDYWKLKQKKDNFKIFLFDQFLHLVVIFLAWLYIVNGFVEIFPTLQNLLTNTYFLAVLIGYLLIIFPAGFLIGKATQRWQEEIEVAHKNNSLEAAGRYIGIFERILVLTFILTDNFSAIGFLIAAKSILRFSDKSETGARKQTEYVLIGTLMSFAITILIGLLIRQFAL
ncbi:MAG TPA: DUF3307 domain-containing protein [Salegentibacter sp.]|uniref:DUF3307 domain-containing protein n=1 Tax=Salegentibacter sp. TaxID=1903072 RepID=UPI002F94D9B9